LIGQSFDWDTATYSDDRKIRADVFVFALHACKDPLLYDPLDLDQWEFRVVPANIVEEAHSASVGLSWVKQHAPEVSRWAELKAAVAAAHDSEKGNHRLQKGTAGRSREL
jgi:hypothetical protein